MTRCLSCGTTLGPDQRFCGRCGASVVHGSELPTATGRGGPADAGPLSPPPPTDSHTTSGHGRFVPGTVLAGRYRIVALLGRGGMAEVYRADDLKLGQPVALKLLPEEFEQDPLRLQRFVDEVKMARQITHANVCRVHDVGEADGRHFLSMEYVDGEDLGSLLRRIGRAPPDKAVQIARELCAGVAAAHAQGILHRDLKPANVMLDGRGRVRITDFGLAGLAETFHGPELRAGTPAYMAPEQLAGREVTARSDLYALGLVLYELFTGRRAYQASSSAELARLQQSAPAAPSRLIPDLDPAVERIILRCLEADPRQRPMSALEIAAGLPGGDPLAAALAAGETPSPEMVANAVEPGALRPAVAGTLLAAALGLVIAAVLFRPVGFLHERVPFELPPQELLARVKVMLADLGYPETPRYSHFGFRPNEELIDHIERSGSAPQAWQALADGTPPAILFWARFSPAPLEPTDFHEHRVRWADPPHTQRGSLSIELDTLGRLVSFERIAPQRPDASTGPAELDRHAIFAMAGLADGEFTETTATAVPNVPTDRVLAWHGPYPWSPEPGEAIVEAGSLNGRLTFFRILGPSNTPAEEPSASGRHSVVPVILSLMLLAVLVGAAWLARRNLLLGRSDRTGAARAAVLVFGLVMSAWLVLGVSIGETGLPHLINEITFGRVAGHALIHAGLFWLLYVALEPYVRRIWPETLVSWTRLLRNRFRDPMVGRDVLVGVLAGGAMANLVLWVASWLEPAATGHAPPPSFDHLQWQLSFLPADLVGSLLISATNSLGVPMLALTLLVLLRILLGRRWLAVAAFFAVFAAISALAVLTSPMASTATTVLETAIGLVMAAVMVGAMLRFGLLAALAASFTLEILSIYLLTFDLSRWYAPGSLIALTAVVGLLVYGFFVSLGGRRLLSDPFDG